jgi:hypothetical protein
VSEDQQRRRRALIAQAVRELGAEYVYLAMGFDTLVEFHVWINAREFIDGWDVARISGAGDLDEGER